MPRIFKPKFKWGNAQKKSQQNLLQMKLKKKLELSYKNSINVSSG